jgi:hypothetical protein
MRSAFEIEIGSGIQTLIRGYTDTQTAWSAHNPTNIFSEYGE